MCQPPNSRKSNMSLVIHVQEPCQAPSWAYCVNSIAWEVPASQFQKFKQFQAAAHPSTIESQGCWWGGSALPRLMSRTSKLLPNLVENVMPQNLAGRMLFMLCALPQDWACNVWPPDFPTSGPRKQICACHCASCLLRSDFELNWNHIQPEAATFHVVVIKWRSTKSVRHSIHHQGTSMATP